MRVVIAPDYALPKYEYIAKQRDLPSTHVPTWLGHGAQLLVLHDHGCFWEARFWMGFTLK